jgi:chromosome segregation ATPase
MVDMLKSSRDDEQRRRDESQVYGVQQQLDELRRQLKENLARQQWFEEMYKQGEGRIAQLQQAQDRMSQDVAQALHARQIDDSRTKGLLSDLAVKVEAPDKHIRDLKAQVQELLESRRTDRDTGVASQRQIDDLHRQIRETNAQISKSNDANKQIRELFVEIQESISEVRQETVHVAELQRMEEQRLRRQGMELQGLFEALRQQFTEIAAKSQRVDDVRHQLTERIEAIEVKIEPIRDDGDNLREEIARIETLATEQYMAEQSRLETVRLQLEAQIGEMRQVGDQRTDRYLSRLNGIDERLRDIDQALSEFPSRFEALERRDEMIGAEADTIEEWLVVRQIAAMETVLDDVRKRRAERAPNLNPQAPAPPTPPTPGSIYNPSGLIKSVRDARPPKRAVDEEG